AYRTGVSNSSSSLRWFDRSGKQVGQLGEPGPYGVLSLSRDGRLVAVQRNDSSGVGRAFYVDVLRGVFTRLTHRHAAEPPQAISPDGRVALTMASRGVGDIYIKRAGSVEEPELLVKSNTVKHPNDWSADAAFVIYDDHHPSQRQDLWIVGVNGDR